MLEGSEASHSGPEALAQIRQGRTAPCNLMLIVAKRLVMRGFRVGDHADRKAAFREDIGGYLQDGRIRVRETVVDGMARAPEAFLALLRGDHIGKLVVRVGPDARHEQV